MNKVILSVVIAIISSAAFAMEKKQARKPNNEVFCTSQAAQAALGAVKGLGQDVTVSKVTLVGTSKNLLTFAVKLEGSGFSSGETNKPLTVKLYDLGDGCGLKSISLD